MLFLENFSDKFNKYMQYINNNLIKICRSDSLRMFSVIFLREYSRENVDIESNWMMFFYLYRFICDIEENRVCQDD